MAGNSVLTDSNLTIHAWIKREPKRVQHKTAECKKQVVPAGLGQSNIETQDKKSGSSSYQESYLQRSLQKNPVLFYRFREMMKQILPNCLDGLFVLFSVQEGRVHFKNPLIWCGWVLWIIQSSAAVQVAAVHLHGIHGSVRVRAGTGWLYKCANVRKIVTFT